MRTPMVLLACAAAALVLSGCGGVTGPRVDMKKVLDRTVETLEKFHFYLKRYDYTEVDGAMFEQFNNTLEEALNFRPRFHATMIATEIRKDASIVGFGDVNSNGKVDAEEPKLFTIEMDPENDRIILTANGGSSVGGSTSGIRGFASGVFVGSLIGRQREAGIGRGHFNRRSVSGAPVKTKVASKAGSTARGRARSGGARAGK